MTREGSLIDALRAADTSALPDLAGLDERRQVFWILRAAKEQLGASTIAPSDISAALRDVYGINISRQRIEGMLSTEDGTVARRKLSGRRAYQLMASGSEELDSAKDATLFIDPSGGYTGLRAAHALLGELEGDLRVCDPYADARTLDMLAECERAGSIRLLTHNIKKPDGFKQSASVFQREHDVALDVRKAASGVLHDRYVIHKGGMLLFGTSLNGLGFKQSFVVALGEDLRSAVSSAFEASWAAATPL